MATATHEERRGVLRYVLEACGYDRSEIAENFPIWIPGRETIRADYVAFTRPDQQDMSTSAIVAQVVDGENEVRERWLPAAAALAAPAILVAGPDRVSAWTSAIDDVSSVEAVVSVPIASRREAVDRLAMLAPDVIARAKGFQRSLFPVSLELLSTSRRTAQTYLRVQVEQALARLGAIYDNRSNPITPKLVIGALATLMIRDKTDLSDLAGATTGTLIDISQHRFSDYFGWLTSLTSRQFEIYSNLIDDLGSDINFASLEPSMVSDVYESALVNRKLRRRQGTYYTDPQLAENMLSVVPIENFEPQRRYILDPACGSGTMLLAAVNRLNQMQTDHLETRTWHQYLTSHLRGYDSDTLATEITKLCLLMSALPIGNSWHVEAQDTLELELPPSERPSLIISNPPWEYHRESVDTAERAYVFLSWILDNLADDGFLACVVPLSWLNRNNSRTSRQTLLNRARLLEAWRLPASIFPATRSTIAPAVIIAQKDSMGHPANRVTIVKTVRDSSLSGFLSTGKADEAYLVRPGEDGDRLTSGPLSRAVEDLQGFTTIGAIAAVHNGRPRRPGRPERSLTEATHREMGSLRLLRPFMAIRPEDLTPVIYPDDYDSANPSDARVKAHKVIVTAKNFGTRNPWRIAVGYDIYGAALREMFHMIIPRSDWESWSHLGELDKFYSLMAVLGSGFASCWIDENEPTRNISTRRITSMPFPTDPTMINKLVNVGKALAGAIADNKLGKVEAAATELEQAVNDVYQLSPSIRRVIAQRLAGAVGHEGIVRYPRPISVNAGNTNGNAASSIPSFGQILNVNEDGLQIWISGVTEMSGTAVSALPQIPGWLCEEGADFRIEGNVSDLYSAKFRFHTYEWLTEDELSAPGLVERRARLGNGIGQ